MGHAGHFLQQALCKEQLLWKQRSWTITQNNSWSTAVPIQNMDARVAAVHGQNGQCNTWKMEALCLKNNTHTLESKTNARATQQLSSFSITKKHGPNFPITHKQSSKPYPPWAHYRSQSTHIGGNSTPVAFTATAMTMKSTILSCWSGTKKTEPGLWRIHGAMPGEKRDTSGLLIREVLVSSRIISSFHIWLLDMIKWL